MNRTTIILEKPLLNKLRQQAHKNKKTLKNTIRELILLGLKRSEKECKDVPELLELNLGPELEDLSNREFLYKLWENEDERFY